VSLRINWGVKSRIYRCISSGETTECSSEWSSSFWLFETSTDSSYRVSYRAAEERIALLKQKGNYTKLSKSIRNQLETAIEILGQRQVNGRERVEKLKETLDQ